MLRYRHLLLLLSLGRRLTTQINLGTLVAGLEFLARLVNLIFRFFKYNWVQIFETCLVMWARFFRFVLVNTYMWELPLTAKHPFSVLDNFPFVLFDSATVNCWSYLIHHAVGWWFCFFSYITLKSCAKRISLFQVAVFKAGTRTIRLLWFKILVHFCKAAIAVKISIIKLSVVF